MPTFEELNQNIVFTKAKNRDEAVHMKGNAIDAVKEGKTVVIFFENRYLLHLAPGQDPYQVRQAIEKWQNNQSGPSPETTAIKKKFLSNKLLQTIQEGRESNKRNRSEDIDL